MPGRNAPRPAGHYHYRRPGTVRVLDTPDGAERAEPTERQEAGGPGRRSTALAIERRQTHVMREHALDNLRFIRETLERAGPFTAVPGWGLVLMGLSALVAAVLAGTQTTVEAWLVIWMTEAALSGVIGVVAIGRKGRAKGIGLLSGPNRRFAFSFAPLVAGALLTYALYVSGQVPLLPGLWLLLFGAGVTSGGALSVRIIPVMGASFMALGALALVAPPVLDDVFMAIGFGGLLVAYGLVIARRYGG